MQRYAKRGGGKWGEREQGEGEGEGEGVAGEHMRGRVGSRGAGRRGITYANRHRGQTGSRRLGSRE